MRKAYVWVAALMICGSSVAMADNGANAPSVTGETGYFNLLSPDTLPKGQWSLGFYYNNWDRLVIPEAPANVQLLAGSSSDWDYEHNRVSASVGYGITDNFELSLLLPWEQFDASNNRRYGRVNGRFFVNEIDAKGFGDVRLGAKYGMPAGDGHFGINGFVDLPTGDDKEGVVTGDTGFGAGLSYELHRWVLNLGYHDPGDADNAKVPAEILGGVGYAAKVSDRLYWLTELAATVYSGGGAKPDDNIDLTTGGRLWFGQGDNWAFNFGLRVDLAQLSDTDEHCPLGGLVGLTYFPHLFREKAAEAARLAAEEEARRLAAEEEARRVAAEEEARRKAEEEARRLAAEEEARRRAEEEARRNAEPPPPPPAIEEVCQFAAGSARVDNRCKATLDEVALRMKNDAERYALVIGYTDSKGGDASNQRISQRRADAVKTYLVSRHGIDGARISTEGKGSADPVGDNATAAGRAQNRRALIILKVR